jgi:hypothetical protein
MRQKKGDFYVLLLTAAWVVVGVIGAAVWAWAQSRPDIQSAIGLDMVGYPVSASMTADELWYQFADDELAAGANQKFDEEYIEVRGRVKTVEPKVIILATGDESHGIECRLLTLADAEGVQKGDPITVHGQSPHRPKDGPNVVLHLCRVRPEGGWRRE